MALLAVEHIHAGLIVAVDAGDVRDVVVEHVDVYLPALGQQAAEAVAVELVVERGVAAVDNPEQDLLAHYIHLERGDALAGAGAAQEDFLGEAVLADDEAVMLALGSVCAADGGDLRAGLDVLVHDVAEVYARGEAAAHEGDVVLLDVLNVPADVLEGVDYALILAGAGEGRQELEAAALAGHIPLLAGAHVVEQGGVVALHDDADVAHARVLQVAQRKVNEPVPAREGQGRARADHDQLAQVAAGAVGQNKSVQVYHFASLPSPAATLS